MSTSSVVKRMGALAVSGGLALTITGTAFAAGSSTTTPTATVTPRPANLTRLKEACEAAIDRRLTSLGELQSTVSSNKYLTSAHQTTLLAEIAAESQGLGILRVKIAGDTNPATLRADCKDIVDQYRVYLLMVPKVNLTIAGDASVAIGAKLDDVVTKLQNAIDKAKAAGLDVTEAQHDLNNMKAAIDAGVGAAQPIATLVNFALPLNPSDFANDHQDVVTARQDARTAHDDFVHARADAKQVISDLKALKTPASGPGVTATATANS